MELAASELRLERPGERGANGATAADPGRCGPGVVASARVVAFGACGGSARLPQVETSHEGARRGGAAGISVRDFFFDHGPRGNAGQRVVGNPAPTAHRGGRCLPACRGHPACGAHTARSPLEDGGGNPHRHRGGGALAGQIAGVVPADRDGGWRSGHRLASCRWFPMAGAAPRHPPRDRGRFARRSIRMAMDLAAAPTPRDHRCAGLAGRRRETRRHPGSPGVLRPRGENHRQRRELRPPEPSAGGGSATPHRAGTRVAGQHTRRTAVHRWRGGFPAYPAAARRERAHPGCGGQRRFHRSASRGRTGSFPMEQRVGC